MAYRDKTVLMTANRPQLHRGLKVLGTLLITISAVSPASAVFVLAPGVVVLAGTGAFLSFVIASVVGLLIAFVYAELASAYPLSGGDYAMSARILGRLPGFIVLGLGLVTLLLDISVIALGEGTYLSAILPGLHLPTVGALTTLLATVLAVFDIKFNAWVTGIFLTIEILALAVVSALDLLRPERSIADLVLHPVVAGANGSVVGASAGMVGGAAAVALFCYYGFGNAVYLGEETRNARRTMARSILWALAIVVVAEMIPVTALLLGAPSLPDLFSGPGMMEYFITARAGSTLNVVISLAIALAIFNCVLDILLIAARMLFSTGRDTIWPAPISRALARVHPRFGSPWVSTLLIGVLAAAACYVDFQFLLVVTSTTAVAIYATLCFAVLAGRRNGTIEHAVYRMPAHPSIPILALIGIAYIVYGNFLDPVVGRPSLYTTAVIILLATAYYFLVLRRRGTWELRGPIDEHTS